MDNKYIGHMQQISGVDELILASGRGKGMRLYEVRNGKGLQFTISADRCADISRLSLDGVNFGYFSPCGYVAPSFYDKDGIEFLKSFTAGFFTTCGLTAVGNPCTDDGEQLGLHGTISNTPCDKIYCEETDNSIIVKAQIRQASLFSHQLLLDRKYVISKADNSIELYDTVTNTGSGISPVMLLYHCNMGYPLLSENAKVVIPHNSKTARNEHAKANIKNSLVMEKPQSGYEEMCYYYDVKENNGLGKVGIFNPDIKKGLAMSFGKDTLNCFTQWKMMGEKEYVLGLEPGNCTPDGRDVLRKENKLKFLKPDEKYSIYIKWNFINDYTKFEEEF